MHGRIRALGLPYALIALGLLVGCSAFDRTRLGPSPVEDPSGDGGLVTDGALPGDGDGDVGMDAGGDRDSAVTEEPDRGCRPAPNPSAACPQICGEVCNGKDDDCDGEIDNASAQNLCDLANASALCIDGECILAECEGRHLDCDNRVDTGCEASLDDLETCGGCNAVCEIDRAIEGCEDGECVPIGCEPGYDDCDDDESTICEEKVANVRQCGACDAACELDHAVPACKDLECVVEQCDSGFDDCDDDDSTGCEAPLDTLENCGGCDTPCDLAGCSGGVCSAIACAAPEADCDGDGVDCEANIATDVPHCGACNTPCEFTAGATTHASGFSCVAMTCEPTCDAEFADCDPDYRNGCETQITTVANCGACGVDCNALLPNTMTTACATGGVCEISGCDPGFGDCDTNDANGCETSTRTIMDCGGCSNVGANQVCSGLANATATTCSSGACAITTCAAGFASCDGDVSNGCERNTTSDGPCLPDTNCTRRVLGANTYYFCTNDVTWSVARDRCRTQRRGNLVHIDDVAENNFVQMYKVADAWIGAGDTLEGTWRWVNDGVPFWRGGSTGTAVLSQYAHWDVNQPDDYMAGEDCAEIWSSGAWNDQSCAITRDFVCEEAPDLCPTDMNKLDPGQCGCNVADTDADSDGFATCNDTCPNDPAKTAPGTCGCGTADTNTDGDAVPDCMDQCPLNALATSSANGCGLGFNPSNVDVTRLNPTQADLTTTIGCAAVLNTNGTPAFTTWCSGALPQTTVYGQSGSTEVAVVTFRNLSITASGSIRVVGSRPAVIVAFGTTTVSGSIDASASGTTANAGGNYACGTAAAPNVADCGNETGGGGGGAYFTRGGNGGNGDDCNGGAGGLSPRGTNAIIPLIGGCNGGNSGGCSTRGAGGGAIQLSVGGQLTVTGTIRANGGVGPGSCGEQMGGGGGGSGGAIRLEATGLTTAGATIETRGGNGGTGAGAGGGAGSASSGANGVVGGTAGAGGGGGGGGGYGRIVLCNRTSNVGCP